LKEIRDTILKTFLSQCPLEKQRDLEQFLPIDERDRLEKIEPVQLPPYFSESSFLEKIHWSWFLPILQNYSSVEQKLFLSALDSYSAQNLAKELTLSSYMQEIKEPAKKYLRSVLAKEVVDQPLLPPEFLPESPLKKLLGLSKKKLTELIEILSLHDLSAELRQIVETKILKKIYSLLSEAERQWLKTFMTRKETFAHTRMNLDRWDGSEETLRTLLHRKGIARLSAAFSGQSPDLLWYISHQLDIGRGNALLKQCKEEPIHGVSDPIIQQIEELL
jgi:hypothetical protein